MINSHSKQYTIGISCIGSGVGESVINSCRLSNLPLKTVGLGTNPFAYGAYACDAMDYTPTIYASDFVDELIKKCIEHKIDFLIPGRDDEAHIYSQNKTKFEKSGIKTLAASEDMIALCRDKERMSLELNPIADVFVKCFHKETVLDAIAEGEVSFPLIAKPRSGFASKGVEIIQSEEDFHLITENHILQELAVPVEGDPNYDFFISEISKNRNPQVAEISIQLVIGKNGELLGKMATYNKLSSGIPIEILPYEDPLIWETVDRLLPEFLNRGLVGPLNIQGRMTKRGLKVFEMNPRFTGITGLRALMGFNEVEACIKSWLNIGDQPSFLEFNPRRFGIRQTADRVMGLSKNDKITEIFSAINKDRFSPRKRVLITGASGYLGQSLVKNLLDQNNFDLILLGRDKKKLERLFGGLVYKCIDFESLDQGDFDLGTIDIGLHVAFARPYQGNQAIAESLELTSTLFLKLAAHHVPLIINISSQSVYGKESGEHWTELSPLAPLGVYGQAKYSTEVILQNLNRIYPQLKTVSLRLGTLCGGQPGLEPVDVLSKMVLQAESEAKIQLFNGQILVERLDVRDASRAIVSILQKDPDQLDELYNIGATSVCSLSEIADWIAEKASSNIIIEDFKNDFSRVGRLDSSKFQSQFQWRPVHTMRDTIDSLFQFFNSTTISSSVSSKRN